MDLKGSVLRSTCRSEEWPLSGILKPFSPIGQGRLLSTSNLNGERRARITGIG